MGREEFDDGVVPGARRAVEGGVTGKCVQTETLCARVQGRMRPKTTNKGTTTATIASPAIKPEARGVT